MKVVLVKIAWKDEGEAKSGSLSDEESFFINELSPAKMYFLHLVCMERKAVI